MRQIGHDGRLAGGQAAQPRGRGFAAARPAQAEADVRRGQVLAQHGVVDVSRADDAARDAERAGVPHDVVVAGLGADEQQTRGREGVRDRRQRAQDLAQPLLRRHAAEGREHDRPGRQTETLPPARRPRRGPLPVAERIADAHPDAFHRCRRVVAAQPAGEPGVVRGDQPRGLHGQPQHRPEVREAVAEDALHAEIRDAGRGVRMVEGELRPVAPLPAAGEEGPGPRLVELAVVQDDQTGVAGQVRPHVVVAGGVPELVHHQVVRSPRLFPDEVVGAERVDAGRALEFGRPAVRVDVDGVPAAERRQQLRRVAGDSRPLGRQRREESEPRAGGGRRHGHRPGRLRAGSPEARTDS